MKSHQKSTVSRKSLHIKDSIREMLRIKREQSEKGRLKYHKETGDAHLGDSEP